MFLFFGNFLHKVKLVSGSYTYCRRTGDFYRDKDLQVIWGYLQVGKIIESPKEQEQLWWHRHFCKSRTSNSTNIIFAASDKLSFDKSKPGAGLLSFDEKRVLTAKGCNKATWKVNSVYDDKHILANRKNNAKDSSQGIYYAGIWQELGLSESEECSSWAKSIYSLTRNYCYGYQSNKFQFVRTSVYLLESCGPGMPGPYGAAAHKRHPLRTYSPTKEGPSMSCFKKVLLLLSIVGGINWGIYGIWGFNLWVAAGRQHELAVPHRVHHRGVVVALPDPRTVYGRDENRRVKVKHRVEMKFSPPHRLRAEPPRRGGQRK